MFYDFCQKEFISQNPCQKVLYKFYTWMVATIEFKIQIYL